jgi:thiamine kinase-like enzyme
MTSSPRDDQQRLQTSAHPFREPIAPSLTPVVLQWELARDSLLSLLRDAFGKDGVFLVASGASTTEISYCRMTNAERGIDMFIKIVPERFATELQCSTAISEYVHGCGLLTPACMPGFPKTCIDGRAIFAYPFVEGSYLNSSLGELQRLGRALARLHTALLSFPDAHKIARAQREMRTRMRRKAKKLLIDQYWASGDLSPVRTHLLRWLEIDAILGIDGCQVIHNDLNAGNVMQDNKGNVWFLDFEEASWSYLPPHFDVAKVIERFILVNENWNIETKMLLSQRLMCEYRDVRGDGCGTVGDIHASLCWLLGFSWLRMSRLLREREAIQHPEVRKFLRLAELLDENEVWLTTL